MKNHIVILFIFVLFFCQSRSRAGILQQEHSSCNLRSFADSVYSAADIKNLAIAASSRSLKNRNAAIELIQHPDLKNLAIAKAADSDKKKNLAIDQIKNPDIQYLAIVISESTNFKQQYGH
jgi:hypothetical protein